MSLLDDGSVERGTALELPICLRARAGGLEENDDCGPARRVKDGRRVCELNCLAVHSQNRCD